MVYGVIYICPECKHTLVFTTEDNGTVVMINRICVDDGYLMRSFLVDSPFVDKLWKGEIGKCQD